MKKLKILVVHTCSSSLNGVTNVIYSYYNQLKNSVEMDFVFIGEPFELLKNDIIESRNKYYILPRRAKSICRYIRQLTKIIKDGKYDIVHAHGNSNTLVFEMIAAQRAGCKVRIAHSHNITCNNKFINALLKPVFLHSYTDGFACGQAAGEWLFGKRPFTIINNGIDLDKFSYKEENRNEIRQKYQINNDEILIGTIGNLNEQKNHKFLLNIAESIKVSSKSYKIMIVGYGHLENELKQIFTDKGLIDMLIFTGKVDNSFKYYSAFDSFIMTSLYEGLPLTLVEAQASGLPIVVADTITKQADICGEFKYLSLNDSTDTWANEVINVHKNNRQIQSVKNIQKLTDSGYDIKKEAQKLEEKYIELIKGTE